MQATYYIIRVIIISLLPLWRLGYYDTMAAIPPPSPRSVLDEADFGTWNVVDSWEWGQGVVGDEESIYVGDEDIPSGSHHVFYNPPDSPHFNERYM